MKSSFSEMLSGLRREKGLSQRRAAADLGISQALLSHYENGAREPKLEFVVKACDYYGVPADYILGRSRERRSMASQLARATGDILDSLETFNAAEAELISKLKGITAAGSKRPIKNRTEPIPKKQV